MAKGLQIIPDTIVGRHCWTGDTFGGAFGAPPAAADAADNEAEALTRAHGY
jgi:hypothetical protein